MVCSRTKRLEGRLMSSLMNLHLLLRLNLKLNLDPRRNVKNQLLLLRNRQRNPRSRRKLSRKLPSRRRRRSRPRQPSRAGTSRWRLPLNHPSTPRQDLRWQQWRNRWKQSLILGLCRLPYLLRQRQKSSQRSKMSRCRNFFLLVSHTSHDSNHL